MEVVSFLIILGSIFSGLFLAVFLLKRRLGVLGLALAAGSILATLWVGSLTPVVAEAGIIIIRPPLSSLVAATLITLPAFLLFFTDASAKSKLQRIISAFVFASLAIAFLLEPLGSALVIDASGKPVYDSLVEYKPIIITMGLTVSILDLLVGKKIGRERDSKH